MSDIDTIEPKSPDETLAAVRKILNRGGDDAGERAREVIAISTEPDGDVARIVRVHRVLADVLYYHREKLAEPFLLEVQRAERDAFALRTKLASS